MPATIKSQITAAIMSALAKVPTPQNRIKTVRPKNCRGQGVRNNKTFNDFAQSGADSGDNP